MKPRRCKLILALLALVFAAAPFPVRAQTISLFPNQVPNGIAATSGDQYHQRFNITLSGGATAQSRAFTVTIPPELTVVSNSVTATSNNSNVIPFFAGTPGTNQLAFGLTLAAGTLTGSQVTLELDVTTPTNFTGISNGTKRDTAYVFDFAAGANQTDTDVPVAKHQNRPVRLISFVSPDSSKGDTTTMGGRFYKLAFPSSGLPDPSHTGISGLSVSAGFADNRSDVLYSFYLHTDSTLIRRPSNLNPAQFSTLRPDGSSLQGTRQNPTVIPGTYIRENFVTVFSSSSADSINGMISLSNTTDGVEYYVYVMADPAPERLPGTRYAGGAGSAKKGYNPNTLGAFSGGVFLGRSGPLFIEHPPEFVVVGWDYDNDTADRFDNTGVIQVPSDMLNMASVDANRKDNRNITVDSGAFYDKGAAFPGLNNNNPPGAASTVDLLFKAEDSDNSGAFQINVFLSTQSGLSVDDFAAGEPSIDDLAGAFKVSGTDTLTINNRKLVFDPIVRDTATNLISSYVPEGDYYVYFAATDGVHRTLTQVFNDPFITSPSAATLTVRHSPNLTPDVFALNSFDGSGDGDMDVVTGIDVSQMFADTDGKDLRPGPAQRFVTISWGEQGLNGDLDVDDNAVIEFYYSTYSTYRDSRGSVAYTAGNSDGSDLRAHVAGRYGDTHKIGDTTEDPDGLFDNQFTWDLWSYASSDNTVPRTGVRYYIYAIFTKNSNPVRLISLTRSGTLDNTGTSMALNFLHPPYIRPTKPERDLTVTVDEPVLVSWEAADVDNEEAGGLTAVPDGTTGRVVSNNPNSSPNIRILLTSADFGEVTTWASVTSAGQAERSWVGNSGDGSLVEEIELNEGVDTSFVIVGNRMRNNLFNTTGLGGSSGTLELQTSGNAGKTYYVYLAIDDGRDGRVADAVTGAGPQQTNFGGFSPLVRAPGTITFTGTVPTNPPTSTRFILPARLDATAGEVIKLPIVPNVSPPGKQINVVDLFITVDANLFEAIDQDAGAAGIQPFSLGENSAISAGNVQQAAIVQGDLLRLDFIYTDVVNGLTFFDGEQPLVIANLRPKSVGDTSTVNTTISLDNSGNRVSKMLDATNTNANAFVPQPTAVTINRRSTLSGKVPLQGRSNSADVVTFMLRPVGSYASIADSLFNLNDIDPNRYGIQVQTTDLDGKFVLKNVPSGRYVLTASAPRHLTGHDTVLVAPGLDQTDLLPTLDGDRIQHAALLAGDAAGFVDSTGTSVPDNAITSDDVNAVNDAIFSQPGDANYNTFADINQDSIVNAMDKDFTTANITSNTGASGSIRPVFPSFKQTLPEGDNTGATVALSGYPREVVRAGETFDVTVEVRGARAVRTYEVHLAFDTTKVAVESVVSRGDFLEYYLTDMVTRVENGEIAMVNSILGPTPVGASGEGTLATIRFRAIGRATESRLVLRDALLIDVEHVSVTPRMEGDVAVAVSNDVILYHDAEGKEIRGLILADVDPRVDLNDFLALAKSFDTQTGETDFDRRADLNADDRVNFADFVIFSSDFGKVAVDAPARAGKPAPSAGVNSRTGMYLEAGRDGAVALKLFEAVDVQGWQASVTYDPARYEFVEAQAPEKNLLSRSGATAPLMLVHREGPDRVLLASAVGKGAAASGNGAVALLRFRPRFETGGAAFELAGGRVIDSEWRANEILPAGEEPGRRTSPLSLLVQQIFKPLWSSAVSP